MNIWDKQHQESTLAYEWFCKYRNIPAAERSQLAVIEKYSKKKSYVTQLARWSKKFDWVKRVEAYDAHVEDKIRLKLEDERVTAARKHIDIANKFFAIVNKKINSLSQKNIKDMSVTELKGLAEFAVKTERDALGIANELNVNSDVNITDKMGAKINKDYMDLVEKALAMRYGDKKKDDE